MRPSGTPGFRSISLPPAADSCDDRAVLVDPSYFLVVAALAVFTLGILLFTRSHGFYSDPATRLPKSLDLRPVAFERLPVGVARLGQALGEKLVRCGYEPVTEVWKLARGPRLTHGVYLFPFVHSSESALFVMSVASTWAARPELMLHIITPLEGERRVETSTLLALRELRAPPLVDLRVVVDANTVEEVWSHHRRALFGYQRQERERVDESTWRTLFEASYRAWLEAAVRAQRLQFAGSDQIYRIRERWEW